MLEALVEKLARQPVITGPRGFTERCDAIELLEMHGASNPRANGLREHFEALNDDEIERVRAEIHAGRLRGDALRAELRKYPGAARDDGDGNLAYDHLDVFVAGLLGTDRLQDADETIEPGMVAYQPTPARVVLELVERVPLLEGDTFVDVGSGLGVVPVLVRLMTRARCVGIEVQRTLVENARSCAQRLNADVGFECVDARRADFSTGTVFYMFTPVRGAMLREVLGRLHGEAIQRGITLCTHGPSLGDAVRENEFSAFHRDVSKSGPLTIFRSRDR